MAKNKIFSRIKESKLFKYLSFKTNGSQTPRSDLGIKLLSALQEKEKQSEGVDKEIPAETKKASLHPKEQIRQNSFISKSTPSKYSYWQFHNGKFSEQREVVIGFDFGTACSKVVLQDRQLKKAFAVPFERYGSRNNKYLIPSDLYVYSDGKLSLSPGGKKIYNLKLSCVQTPELKLKKDIAAGFDATAFDMSAAYVGLVLREIREWFDRTKSKDYKHIHIDWQLNIGMPSRSYDDERLYRTIKRMALTGWNLTISGKDEFYIDGVKEADKISLNQMEVNSFDADKGQLHPEIVDPVPEIIAEVIGYAHSQLRHNGMYLLADIGASTMDVSTFILFDREEEDFYSILHAEVERLGAFILHHHRIKELEKIFEDKFLKLKDACDGISPLPRFDQYLPSLNENDKQVFSEANKNFLCKCSRLIRRVVGTTKKRRNPLASEWGNGLPIFLCGGGSQVELYKNMIKDVEDKLKQTGFGGFNIKILPRPDNLDAYDIPPSDYHRIAVSYGLSHSEIDLGKIIPQRDMDDFTCEHSVVDVDKRFVDKDMV
ncbi:MAG: hypothetical protein BA863_02585 [Desulfovibrio sp. S3730MH75]|nr:MAG: hypothetical protein BA863_02585 [Desulfovibrio sp. S3730MH75]